ncbi:diacylglycerol kinase family protein [Qipengyuania thermophila]|uniref:diacylglycerol kinase family protein n=1 Tax=Qipengyuania thermophila TaxID=2509361 RepID=UPI0013ED4BF9|nr:diacylglycerol kinase family protein [Qipengyuania thermophila]
MTNSRSGSNAADSQERLLQSFAAAGVETVRVSSFPDDAAPAAETLAETGNPVLAIYTGDGSVNSMVGALDGWEGQVLVLPGGTKNLLAQRLHGEADAGEIIARFGRGAMRPVPLKVIATDAGIALVDLLAGPGASWQAVREAMRERDLAAIAGSASEAIGVTTAGPGVRCLEPPLGAEEGYPLLKLMPTHRGIQIDAYHAEGLGDYLAQGWALLRREFRSGPHDRLGLVDEVSLAKADCTPIDVLLDGEAHQVADRSAFTLVEHPTLFLASDHGY